MPIAAAVIPAVIGGAATLYGADQAAKANKKTLRAQQEAEAQRLALEREQFERATQLNAPYNAAGYSALDQLLANLGLGPQGGQPDWGVYLKQNPDVAQRAQEGVAEGVIGQGKQWATPEAWAQYHYENGGKAEGRTLPLTEAPKSTLPAAPTKFSNIAEPGEAPGFGGGYDEYAESAEFKDKVRNSARLTNSSYAAKGLLRSGGAVKAVQDRATDLAEADYQEWFDRAKAKGYFELDRYKAMASQYNADRQTVLGQYNGERAFATDNLFRLTGIGQSAANNTAAAGSSYATNAGASYGRTADNQASYYANQAQTNAYAGNALATGATNIFNAFSGMSREPRKPQAFSPAVIV